MQNDLHTNSYDFKLPDELIAHRPVPGRHNSKLLVYYQKSNRIEDRYFYELPEILPADYSIVFNQSKVFPCRLFGKKKTGGKCEVFFLSLIHAKGEYPAMIKTSGKKNIGDEFFFDQLVLTITRIEEDGTFFIKTNMQERDLINFLEVGANIPIPPYIRGGIADEKDKEDYQTVYAKELGSVAAPTAGLHFTDKIFKDLEAKGITKNFITLHVGAGTFKPVTTDNILDHSMHKEHFDIDDKTLADINQHIDKLCAVGTTSLRVLESCYKEGQIVLPKEKSTDIFLHPGKEVKSIRALITNFHLPKSTLFMLISTIIGREKALELYQHAIENKYRFFSYGDSMLILRDH